MVVIEVVNYYNYQQRGLRFAWEGSARNRGGAKLLEELEKKINVEGAVVVCKCMGKCKDGPNIRPLNQHHDNNLDKERPRTNILCSGIGLEDVEVIVANFMGNEDMGLLTT